MEVPVEKIERPKKFSDTYGQPTFDFPGKQVEEKCIRDQEMTIFDFAILNGTFGEFLVIDAELLEPLDDGIKRIQFAEGSDVVRKQLKKAKEDGNLPIMAKIEERTSEKSKMTYRTLA